MISIDASFGYGQVLRTAISLAALLKKPIRIYNIRKGRPKPGLRPQHYAGIKVIAEFTNAKVTGLRIGSMKLEFVPGEIKLQNKKINIGTAGSIPLLLQALFPLLIFGDREVELEIIGGTAGLGSPTIEYFKHVFLPMIGKMGAEAQLQIVKQGYYPRGGGKVRIASKPISKLKNLVLVERGKILKTKVISIIGNMPLAFLKEQTSTALKILKESGIEAQAKEFVEKTLSAGSSLLIFAECQKSILGSDNHYEKGKSAEQIAKQAAEYFVKVIEKNVALDKFMADQIIPYLALAHGNSKVSIDEATDHVKANIKIVNKILDTSISLERNLMSVRGIGFQKN